MRTRLIATIIFVVFVVSSHANGAAPKDPFASVIPDKKDLLQQRLDAYVSAYKRRDWKVLFGLVSDTARGDAQEKYFAKQMKTEHEITGSEPDLHEFLPNRTKEDKPGFDIYGCGKATREGMSFHGIAVVHVIYEHDNWFFSGWSFTEFPNEPCSDLKKPNWNPYGIQDWSQQMIELRPIQGTPFHIN